MSNIFDDVLGDMDNLEEEILGPSYSYSDNIKSPSNLGMSTSGKKIQKNADGLFAYSDILLFGKSKASKTGKPLGNKFFMETGAKCTDVVTGKQVTRSIYVNNIPDGSIPFLSADAGINMTTFEGIVPGIISNVAHINPLGLLQAFVSGANPDCQAIEMQTVDSNNNKSTDMKYLTNLDIKSMNPCWFPNKTNPITNKKCSESFSNMTPVPQEVPNLSTIAYLSALIAFVTYIIIHSKSTS